MEIQHLQGVVERLTYVSEDGYTVLRLKAPGHVDLVTVVGHLLDVNPGASLKMEGQWVSHSRYGRQFRVERCEQELPATQEGIKRYLGSGLIKGVGPVTADRIVRRFGLDTLRVLEEDPGRLREALGVGPKRAALIADAAGLDEYRLESQESVVYGQTTDIVAGDPGIEVGSAAMGPHQLDRAWRISVPWVGIGFGLERLLMVKSGGKSLGRMARSLTYLDGVRLNI